MRECTCLKRVLEWHDKPAGCGISLHSREKDVLPVIEESMLLDWLISYWGNQSMKMGPLPVWDPALRLRFQNKCTGLFCRKMGYVLVGCHVLLWGGSLQWSISLIFTVPWDPGAQVPCHQRQTVWSHLCCLCMAASFSRAAGGSRGGGDVWLCFRGRCPTPGCVMAVPLGGGGFRIFLCCPCGPPCGLYIWNNCYCCLSSGHLSAYWITEAVFLTNSLHFIY